MQRKKAVAARHIVDTDFDDFAGHGPKMRRGRCLASPGQPLRKMCMIFSMRIGCRHVTRRFFRYKYKNRVDEDATLIGRVFHAGISTHKPRATILRYFHFPTAFTISASISRLSRAEYRYRAIYFRLWRDIRHAIARTAAARPGVIEIIATILAPL